MTKTKTRATNSSESSGLNKFIRMGKDSIALISSLFTAINTSKVSTPSHHVLVVDRSGSMYSDIEALKQTIEQSLAVDNAFNPDSKTYISLISFSTHGDVKTHWNRVKSTDLFNQGTKYISELRNIQATALTGISQGLLTGEKLIQAKEVTVFTLFTDGYANSPSSYAEVQALDAWAARMGNNPHVSLNCIGYRDWCDWPRMQTMSNALRGRTVKAKTFKDVHELVRSTQRGLESGTAPLTDLPAIPGMRYVYWDPTSGQVNMTREGQGLQIHASPNAQIFTVESTSRRAPKHFTAAKADDRTIPPFYPILALGFLGLGDIRACKQVLFNWGQKEMWENHRTAITPSALADLGVDLTRWTSGQTNESDWEFGRNVLPKHSFNSLMDVVNKYSAHLSLDSEKFYKTYRRRSEKRVEGTRVEGKLIPAQAKILPRPGTRSSIRGFSFNNSDATIQLNTVQPVQVARLHADGSTEIVDQVRHISLNDINDYRSFTLVSSGELNVAEIPLQVFDKNAWSELTAIVGKKGAYKPGKVISIPLRKFDLVDSDRVDYLTPDRLLNLTQRWVAAIAEEKIYSAMYSKGEGSPYVPEQIEALRELHLTPALNFSPPTTMAEAVREEAINAGRLDSYTRYKVKFGLTDILSPDDFRSANELLQRKFIATADGQPVNKPKLMDYGNGHIYEKKPKGKGVDTAADEFMLSFMNPLLTTSARINNNEIAKRLSDARDEKQMVLDQLQPLVMQIGCTGLLPPQLESEMVRYEPDDFAAKYSRKLSKDEKEAIYFVYGDKLVISVVPETCWYTV